MVIEVYLFIFSSLGKTAPKSPIFTRSRAKMTNSNNNTSNIDASTNQRIQLLEQTMMKVARQVQMLTQGITILQEV